VYALANKENVDGLISWSSTMGYAESTEEFKRFHQRFDPLPYVTLAYKIPGHPCVEFDAYQGMKALVAHCIRFHGARKIAFLRGPGFHQSALARFQGYADALKEAALDFKPFLVSEPVNWDQGAAAAAQLFEKQGLVPGRDFDTLIGSSDLMVFGALRYFVQKGYHVPRDYHAGGFNNSGESRLLPSPLSTVHLPYTELSAESFGILLKLLNHKQPPPIQDVLLEVDLIIRESCGCTPRPAYGEGLTQRFTGSGSSDPRAVLRSLVAERLKLPPGTVKALVSPVIHAVFYEDPARFLYRLQKALGCFFNSGKDPELLVRLFEEIAAMGILPQDKTIAALAYGTLFRMQEQQALHTRYKKEQWNTILNSLKCELLGTRDRGSLVRSLARYLPEIGITTGAIVLYEDGKISVWVGSFSPQGIDPLGEHRFPSGLLFPREVNDQYCQGVFMVQPLFIENQSLGYFIHGVPLYDGVLLEDLRSAVSYALKGISLLEAVSRAKQIAEQAKTALLQVLENERSDPLAEVMERLDQLEKKIPPGPGAGAALEALKGLKGLVASREAEADRVIDRTLSRINELSLRKTLFDLEELLPGIGVFPLLAGDVSRLSQCFSLIREE
jgi:DNA-binding LacI/PurR family transcriptional regulator